MKIVDNFKKIVSDFTRASNSTSNIGNQFLRQGNRKTMSQDWSSVLMSDQDIYTGYPYGIINKRANKLAYLAISNLHTDTSKDISTKDAEKGIVHPYLQLIDKSPSFSNFKFWHDISVFLDLEGVYYVMAVRNFENNNDSTRYGDIQDFEMLNPYNIRRVVNARTLELGGYVEHRNGLSREIPKEMIIEIKDLNPFDENDPYSMTDALTNAQFTLRQANDYTRHSLKNNLSAPGAISTDVVLEDQQFSNFVNRITNQEKGMPLFGNGAGSIKWDPMQIEMDKAALDKITDINRSELFAVSGVGKTNLAIEESGTTRETAKVQKDLLTEDHTIPKLQLIIDALNQDYKNKYPKEYEKTGYTITIQSPLGVDKDSELKDIKIRSDTVALYNSMVDNGYNPEIAARFVNGEIQLKDIGMPQKPVSQKDDKTIIKEDKDDSGTSESDEKNALLIKNSQELIISTIESKLQSIEDKVNNKIVVNVEKEKKITVDNAGKKTDNLQPIEKTNQQNNPIVPTDTVIIRNAVDDDSQSVIETQQGSLQNSIVDIETRLTGSVLTNFNKIENQLNDESEILSQEERNRLVSELTLVLAGFYMLIIPLYARTIANRRLKEFGSSTDFEVNNEVKEYIDQISSQVSESHINTIFTDLYRNITNTYNDIVESQIEKIKETGRKVTDDDLVLARKTALEGGSRQQIINSIKDEYKDITANRAKAIARTETNRAFTQAQYQADLQFIKQNGYDGQAYKKWITRSSNPCPTCLDLASQPPIPFTKNFADLGDEIVTTYEDNGKMKVKTQMVDFEPLQAGNAHVNCGCTYQLIIENNVLNNFEKDENSGNPYRDPSSGRFTFGPSGGGAYRDDDMTIGQFEEFAKGYSGSATEAELKHINDYQNSEARPINANLKETKGKTDKQSLAIGKGDPSNTTEYYIETYGGQRQELVKTMDSKMIHSLKENHILYRGMSVDADLKVGDSIKSYGFTSSSFSKDIAATFTFNGIRYSSDTTKEYVLRVIAPEGTKGLIPHALTGARTIEQEFIFPRGTDFKVTKIIGPGHTESEGKYTPSYNYTIIEVTL